MGNTCSTCTTHQESEIQLFIKDYTPLRKEKDIHFGEITLMQHKTTKEYVALKELLSKGSTEFKTELQELKSKLNQHHPNILRLISLNTRIDDKMCSSFYRIQIIFEYYNSDLQRDIEQRSRTNNRYSEDQLWELFHSVLKALAALNQRGRVHGDIRPDNILISAGNTYKIADPDLVVSVPCYHQHLTGVTEAGGYLSPNLLKALTRQEVNPKHQPDKSDIFSLGMTLLNAATLSDCNEFYDWEKKTINEKELNECVSSLRNAYSPELLRVLESALKFDESHRPSANELINEVANRKVETPRYPEGNSLKVHAGLPEENGYDHLGSSPKFLEIKNPSDQQQYVYNTESSEYAQSNQAQPQTKFSFAGNPEVQLDRNSLSKEPTTQTQPQPKESSNTGELKNQPSNAQKYKGKLPLEIDTDLANESLNQVSQHVDTQPKSETQQDASKTTDTGKYQATYTYKPYNQTSNAAENNRYASQNPAEKYKYQPSSSYLGQQTSHKYQTETNTLTSPKYTSGNYKYQPAANLSSTSGTQPSAQGTKYTPSSHISQGYTSNSNVSTQQPKKDASEPEPRLFHSYGRNPDGSQYISPTNQTYQQQKEDTVKYFPRKPAEADKKSGLPSTEFSTKPKSSTIEPLSTKSNPTSGYTYQEKSDPYAYARQRTSTEEPYRMSYSNLTAGETVYEKIDAYLNTNPIEENLSSSQYRDPYSQSPEGGTIEDPYKDDDKYKRRRNYDVTDPYAPVQTEKDVRFSVNQSLSTSNYFDQSRVSPKNTRKFRYHRLLC